MEEEKYLDWIGKYLSGNIDGRERAELLSWVAENQANQAFFDEMIRLWSISSDFQENFTADVPAAWQKLEDKLPTNHIPNHSANNIRRLSNSTFILRIAAAILLLLSVGYWWYTGSAEPGISEFSTAAREQKTVTLPDGSVITLNEQTLLTYQEQEGLRQVHLEGEAFFSVARMEDKPFVIQSGQAKTTVLGTSFNVRAYPEEEEIEVTVETGLVQFAESVTGEEAVSLEAGTSAVFDKKEVVITKIDQQISNALAWKTKTLDFQDTPMPVVLATLERYYDTRIGVANKAILNCTYKGTFENKKLEEIMGMIAFATDSELSTTSNGGLIMDGPGCD